MQNSGINKWPEDSICDLYELYRILLKNIERNGWNYHYKEGLPYKLPDVVLSEHPLDRIVLRLHQIFQRNIDAFVRQEQMQSQGFSYEPNALQNDIDDGFPTKRLTADLLPFWQLVFENYKRIPIFSKDKAYEFFNNTIKPKLEKDQRKVAISASKALNIIDLPFWRERWHTYEVWASVATLLALDEFRPIPVVENNSVPIDGYSSCLLAYLKTLNHISACVAIQVQTPYFTSGRKAIKPDLRVCFSDQFDASETAAIVEFKQRLHMTAADINGVFKAYMGGSPKCHGTIILNYDSVPSHITLDRGHFVIGDMHPCNPAALSEYKITLQGILKSSGIQPLRKNIIVLLDVSGSMAGLYRSSAAAETLQTLTIIRYVHVFTFNEGLTTGQRLKNDSSSQIYTSGGTDLGKAINDLSAMNCEPDRLLILTDGEYQCPSEVLKSVPAMRECLPSDARHYIAWLLNDE